MISSAALYSIIMSLACILYEPFAVWCVRKKRYSYVLTRDKLEAVYVTLTVIILNDLKCDAPRQCDAPVLGPC